MTMPTKKLVIATQFSENYGSHDWDGKGACPQHWKMKGGSTYVVYGITPAMEERIAHAGIPTLTSLVTFRNEYAAEEILNMSIVDKNESVVAEWEHEIVLSYDRTIGAWRANIEREPYMPQDDFDMISESWVMDTAGDRVEGTYHMLYRDMDGHWVTEATIMDRRGVTAE